MLSMCGMLCRFLRGWRQSEAVEHMAHVAATLKDSSLIIEIVDLDSKTSKYESSPENSESWGHSSFCQPFCGQRSSVRQEQLWRDNNKQATIVSPKERVDLIHWTQFTSSLPSKGKNLPRDIQPHYSASAPTSTNHSPMTSRRNSACSECDNVITVLFEASYKEKGERLISHCNVMVEHFSEPLAWKMRDAFGIIVYTTPAMLVSLIHAFFNNSLVIDDDLTVDKILTVDLVGEPFTTCDPSTISSSVTPGPWSSSDLYSHLDASGMSLISFEVMKCKGKIGCENGDYVVGAMHSLAQVNKVKSQSREEERSTESEFASLKMQQLCPRGWAVSGLRTRHSQAQNSNQCVVLGQPLSVQNSTGIVLPQSKLEASIFTTSIIPNPLNELFTLREALSQTSRLERKQRPLLHADKHFETLFSRRDVTNPMLQRLHRAHRQMKLKSKDDMEFSSKIYKSSANLHEASFHGKENFEYRRKFLIDAAKDQIITHEPTRHLYPAKMKCETDLLKSTSILKDNLANIVENYLTKFPRCVSTLNDSDKQMTNVFKKPEVVLFNDGNQEKESESPGLYTDNIKSRFCTNEKEDNVEILTEDLVAFSGNGKESLCHFQSAFLSDPNDAAVAEIFKQEIDGTKYSLKQVDQEESKLRYHDKALTQTVDVTPSSWHSSLAPSGVERDTRLEGDFFLLDSLNEKSSCTDLNLSDSCVTLKIENNENKLFLHLDDKNSLKIPLEDKNSLKIPLEDKNSMKIPLVSNSTTDETHACSDGLDIVTSSEMDGEILSPFEGSGKSLCSSVSFEDGSFSEDSLASGPNKKLSPLRNESLSSTYFESQLSTPEDFAARTDALEELTASQFPSHWHEEYVKIFSDANSDLRENAYSGAETSFHILDPIQELEMGVRESNFSKNVYSLMPEAHCSYGFGVFAKGSPLNPFHVSHIPKNKLQPIMESHTAVNDEELICSPTEESLLNASSPDDTEDDAIHCSTFNIKRSDKMKDVNSNSCKMMNYEVPHFEQVSGAKLENFFAVNESDERLYLCSNERSIRSEVQQREIYENPVDMNLKNDSCMIFRDLEYPEEECQSLPDGITEPLEQMVDSDLLVNHDINIGEYDGNKICDSVNILSNNLSLCEEEFDPETKLQKILHNINPNGSAVEIHDPLSLEPFSPYLESESEMFEVGYGKDKFSCSERLQKSDFTAPKGKQMKFDLCLSETQDMNVECCHQSQNESSLKDLCRTSLEKGVSPSLINFAGDIHPVEADHQGVACSNDMEQQYEPFVFPHMVKVMLSSADSAPESGFASLKGSSHSEGSSESRGLSVPFSKSKDSLEMTDSERERVAGVDILLGEFDSLYACPGDGGHQAGSTFDSLVSFARGSFMEDLGLDDVSVDSDHQDSENNVTGRFQSSRVERNSSHPHDHSNSKTGVEENHDEIKARSADKLEVVKCEFIIDNSYREKSEEGQVMRTSDSVSSSDTIVSRSFEEPGKKERNAENVTFFTASCSKLDKQITESNIDENDNKNVVLVYLKNEDTCSKVLSNDAMFPLCNCQFSESRERNDGDILTCKSCLSSSNYKLNSGKHPLEDKDESTSILVEEIPFSIEAKCNILCKTKYQNDLSEITYDKNIVKSSPIRIKKPKSLEEVMSKRFSLVLDANKPLSKSLSGETKAIINGKRKFSTPNASERSTDSDMPDSLHFLLQKNDEKNLSMFYSDNASNKSSSEKSTESSEDRSFISSRSNTLSSSGEIMNDKVSLKSQDSLDKFSHFEAICAQMKPKTGPRKKVLSVDVEKISDAETSIQRSTTLPVTPTLKWMEKQKELNEKSKEKKRNTEEGKDKKSFLSLKDFLKRNKSKEKEKTGKRSLFKKLEKKTREGLSASPKLFEKRQRVEISNPFPPLQLHGEEMPLPPSSNSNAIETSDLGENKTSIKSTMLSSNAFVNSANVSVSSESEESASVSPSMSQHSTPITSPRMKGPGINESPKLYRRVLMGNHSNSQELNKDSPIILHEDQFSSKLSPKHSNGVSTSVPGGRSTPDSPVLGTKPLRETTSSKSFSVTIGFKPHIWPPVSNRTMSIGDDLHRLTMPLSSPSSTPQHLGSTLSKRSSSMEILVYGKIKEHIPKHKKVSGGSSREGSFNLRREISVETMREIPELDPGPQEKQGEDYQEYLQRVHESRDSRQSSTWSLCENDGSLCETLPLDPPHQSPSHTPLHKKLSLPHSLRLSEPTGGVTLSNPNLSKEHSTLKRGLSLSSSFSSSPLKKLSSGGSSSFQVFSPVKRIFHWSGKSVTSSDNDSCPASPLVEEKEENECAKVAIARGKPPNLLIYAASNHQYFDDVKKTLEMCLEKDRYVIYHLTNEMAFKSPWVSNTALLVVCGDVPTHLSTVFIRYLLDGGNVLSICSDFMNVAVPLYGSVEVQEADVVSLSYRKWKNVKLLHHQHCSHSSPKHQRASTHTQKKSNSGSAVSVEPTSVEITDEHGVLHLLQLDVLARDDTWGAPSLLVARLNDGRGKAIFSQVHLEKNSEESISVKLKRGQLKASDVARIEILKDLLERHLGLYIKKREQSQLTYTHGFILGEHELKQKLLNDVKPFLNDSQLARRALILEFQDYNSQSSKPSDNLLPILMTGCPPNFSTVKYFEELKTVSIGRLVIYSEVLTSTMNVISGSPPLGHGVVVIATQQTSGKGRHGNVWLSPHGCLMISVQLQFSMTSHIGQRLPLLQHLISLATVLGVKTLSGYESLPLFLKWPNDIYVGSKTKIGGVLVDAASQKGTMVVNAGLGLNLANELPTISVNSVIREWNEANGAELAPLNREIICANIFNQLEKLLDEVQQNGSEKVIMEYYNHWLHGDAHVSVQNELGHKNVATIVGIDNYGFLMAHLESGEMIILHPDGNSFNMMEGLIYTKIPKI